MPPLLPWSKPHSLLLVVLRNVSTRYQLSLSLSLSERVSLSFVSHNFPPFSFHLFFSLLPFFSMCLSDVCSFKLPHRTGLERWFLKRERKERRGENEGHSVRGGKVAFAIVHWIIPLSAKCSLSPTSIYPFGNFSLSDSSNTSSSEWNL